MASPVLTREPAHFIDGSWHGVDEGDTGLEVVNPADESVLGRTPEGGQPSVERACLAAARALESWAWTDPQERGRAIARIADGLERRRDELAAVITAEVGVPVRSSGPVQVDLGISILRYYADLASTFAFEEMLGNSRILRRPVGVIGAITPWNYPIYQIVSKLGPALAAGCTVVLKPSEVSPFSAVLLADEVLAAELPAGVVNVVFGSGERAGEAVARDPRVDRVSFTGSTRAGRRVAVLAAERVRPVSLELGGKSAALVLEGADVGAAVADTLGKCFANSGQNCGATSRLIVPRSMEREAIDRAVEVAAGYVTGDPNDPRTNLGPLVSSRQRERVRSLVETGIREGARLELRDDPSDFAAGYFVGPHVFSGVDAQSTIAQEEIFGPVLSIISYSGDVDEGIRIANGTEYGLCGSVWAASDEQAYDVARRVRAGQVDTNGAPYNALAPFGGFGMSGFGRELGPFGMDDYVALQAVQLPTAGEADPS